MGLVKLEGDAVQDKKEKPPSSGAAQEAREQEEPEDEAEAAKLRELLGRLRLDRFTEALRELGLEAIGDLAYLQDADLERVGMPVIPRRKLLEAAGGNWRGPSAEARPLGQVERIMRPTDEEAPPADSDAELEQLVRNVHVFIEDFCEVNNLGIPARAELLGLPPRAALRTMGLLGRGNAFAMQGVRRPSAAARSRARKAAATEALGGAAAAGLPFEDWRRLLEGFASANSLLPGGTAWDALRALNREQALHVMGFTSGLRFLLPGGDGAAEQEAEARVQEALRGEAANPTDRGQISAAPAHQGRPLALDAPETAGPAATAATAAPGHGKRAGTRETDELTLVARGSPGRSAGPPPCSWSRSLTCSRRRRRRRRHRRG
mmetsp:Transcript_68653/g.217031  ORF Transcript_68653/g.217031 Transcript_68653/m.217031 type:complete len:378 (-) Transcript_68653:44-1177(-)